MDPATVGAVLLAVVTGVSEAGRAGPVRERVGDVSNTVSGGIQCGPVLQGRDFTNLTFGAASAPPRDPDAG